MASQSHDEIGKGSRPVHRHDRAQLIAAAHVIALNFQTIAAANEWWRHSSTNANDVLIASGAPMQLASGAPNSSKRYWR
jgi:hypothetical protein